METLRVLVVDDEPGMCTGARRALEKHPMTLSDLGAEVSFEVADAPSGEKALEIMQTSLPDILLLDHKMRGMSGLDVLGQIVERGFDVLTVMITAYASIDVAISATKRGAYDFLAKPFTPDELRGTVRKAARHILLQRQARQLREERRQVRFQFISVLAHELKAPLSAMEGYLRLLADEAVTNPATRSNMIERCLVRSEHMRKMIADLLDLTRIESGQKVRELVDVNLVAVARTAIETAASQAREHDVTISLDAPERLVLRADAGEIEIILNNLVSNAVKYNRDGGRVDVRISASDAAAVIEVADTGIGMKPEESARLFGEFVRIRNDRTRDILGSGLGLSIVRKLASLYAGNVSVRSEPDVGSTFTVVLSSAPAPTDPAPAATET